MNSDANMVGVAKAMVEKGILAADESTGTIEKHFNSVEVECNEENRRKYRNMLFTAPNLNDFISGVILYDETIRQKTDDGVPFAQYLSEHGIIPGIKVDKGAKPLAGFDGEKVTEGLDGLRERLKEYKDLGAQFTKWRTVITPGDDLPTMACVSANAHALARFAALSQEAGLVPIVEPEVVMEHDLPIDEVYEITQCVLSETFSELRCQDVTLQSMILKPNMVIHGTDSQYQATNDQIVYFTHKCLMETVPAAVPGIAFLSGGQHFELATERLSMLTKKFGMDHPWRITYSFGRALQQPALRTWAGNAANNEKAQAALLSRAEANYKASVNF